MLPVGWIAASELAVIHPLLSRDTEIDEVDEVDEVVAIHTWRTMNCWMRLSKGRDHISDGSRLRRARVQSAMRLYH